MWSFRVNFNGGGALLDSYKSIYHQLHFYFFFLLSEILDFTIDYYTNENVVFFFGLRPSFNSKKKHSSPKKVNICPKLTYSTRHTLYWPKKMRNTLWPKKNGAYPLTPKKRDIPQSEEQLTYELPRDIHILVEHPYLLLLFASLQVLTGFHSDYEVAFNTHK